MIPTPEPEWKRLMCRICGGIDTIVEVSTLRRSMGVLRGRPTNDGSIETELNTASDNVWWDTDTVIGYECSGHVGNPLVEDIDSIALLLPTD